MKKYLCALLLLTCCYSNRSFAQDKIYIHSKEVMVAQNGIFVNIDGYAEKVDSVHFDEGGLYIEPIKNCVCGRCGTINMYWKGKKCNGCGLERN